MLARLGWVLGAGARCPIPQRDPFGTARLGSQGLLFSDSISRFMYMGETAGPVSVGT